MDYSISIGIETYGNLNKTLYAENDAIRFDNIMKNVFNVKESILLIGNEASYMNTQNKYNKCIEKLTEDDRLFFFFAGHGKNYFGSPYISSWDSNNDDIGKTWHNLVEFLSQFNESSCKRAIFLIDACESTINFGLRNGEINEFSPTDISHLTNVEYTYVFSSASHKEKASVNEETKHGIWSTFLFEALEGNNPKALVNKRLTNISMQNFLSVNVEEYCKTQGHKQKSFTWGICQREFLISDYSIKNDLDSKEIKTSIKEMYFGIIDADNELKNDRVKFEKNFYNLNDVAESIQNDKNIQLVLGKKGTGKTYIGKYIEEINKDQVTYINFEKFNYTSFNALKDAKAIGYERYQLVWEWVLLSFVVELLSSNENNIELKELYEEIFYGKMTLDKVLNKRLKKGVSISEKYKNYIKKTSNVFSIDDLVELYKVLLERSQIQDFSYLILDGLDEKINEATNYKEILNSLLWTVKHLNDVFYENELDFKIVIFLRNDVYEMISGANLGKIHFGSTKTLTWINDSINKYDYPLADFIQKRINNFIIGKGGQPSELALANILPEKVKEMDSWEWLLNFTTYKPRDIIAFFNSARELCKNNEKRMTEQILRDATKDYSKYLKQEFEDELYGFLNDEQKLDVFNNILPKMKMNWVNFVTIRGYINQTEHCTQSVIDNSELINLLYSVGVIGTMSSENFENWSYRGKRTKLNPNEIPLLKYKVHQGLWKVLSIW
ncbi:P-loop ATPase, Sll1717 family [Paenibacillus sp. UNC499MF]|uniref:caspase family protein n=1 Tax=Paenibacillus sp. UNC499MF TaxID=1502751 RepID=UPI0008A04C50|nr:caspase family protein [Paenibacillus sp. UNC499MF]SEG79582.1 Caspase domain-containing protein [Paenibacillus sp. UNC499MF]